MTAVSRLQCAAWMVASSLPLAQLFCDHVIGVEHVVVLRARCAHSAHDDVQTQSQASGTSYSSTDADTGTHSLRADAARLALVLRPRLRPNMTLVHETRVIYTDTRHQRQTVGDVVAVEGDIVASDGRIGVITAGMVAIAPSIQFNDDDPHRGSIAAGWATSTDASLASTIVVPTALVRGQLLA